MKYYLFRDVDDTYILCNSKESTPWSCSIPSLDIYKLQSGPVSQLSELLEEPSRYQLLATFNNRPYYTDIQTNYPELLI